MAYPLELLFPETLHTQLTPLAHALRHFTALPRRGTPAAELTERDKVALAIAAGAPFETVMDGTMLTVRTTVPVGVAGRGDGGYIVAIGPKPG